MTRAELSGATDEELARRVQAGDFAAFEELFSRYQRPILAYLYQLTRHYDDAACLAQDVFLKVFERVESFDTTRRFSTWLYTIARNAAFDQLDSKRRRSHVPISTDDTNEVPIAELTSHAPVEQALQRADAREIVAQELAALPAQMRELIELTVFQDKSYEEASIILGGIPVGTLRSRVFHAMRLLRARIESRIGPGGAGML